METKDQRITRRHREREARMKATPGYKVWAVAFTLFYPFVAVFTFLFSGLLAFFSGLSRGLAWLASGGKTR